MAESVHLSTKRSVIICVFFVNIAFVILFVIWSIQFINREDRIANHKPILSNSTDFDHYFGRFVYYCLLYYSDLPKNPN